MIAKAAYCRGNFGGDMLKIDPYFLYQVGSALHPLLSIEPTWYKNQVRPLLWVAENWLDTLLNKSIYRLQMSYSSGTTLLSTINRIQTSYSQIGVDLNTEIDWLDYHYLMTQAQAFEAVLAAELQSGQLYLVQPKGGYDTRQLTENGCSIFPQDLVIKAPEAINDATEAARCIAFELPTAAAFHLHRVNEIILRKYYEVIAPGKNPPEKLTIMAYVNAMKSYHVGDKKVIGALCTLNNLHRNPVIHPEQRLDSVEEAIALLGSVFSVVSYMLKEIPDQVMQNIIASSNLSVEHERDTTRENTRLEAI